MKHIIFIAFSSYWAITTFFNFPESSVVIGENFSAYKMFEKHLYQKWQFFAPPPQSNTRLYFVYTYKNKKNQIEQTRVEVFEKYVNKIQNEYLLNDVNANVEYLVFNNTTLISEVLYKLYTVYKVKNNCEDDSCYGKFYDETIVKLEKLNTFEFLMTHSHNIAKKLKLPEECAIQLIIMEKEIPKYADRYKKNVERKERVTFMSNIYNFKTKKWINNKDLWKSIKI